MRIPSLSSSSSSLSLSIVVAGVVTFAAACEQPAPAPEKFGLDPPAADEGIQMAMQTEVPGGTEAWKCSVYDLPRTDDFFFHVNRVHSQQTSGTHHMTISTLAFADVDIEPGEYDCEGLYADNPQLMSQAVMVYGSQDIDAELQLPEGVVASLPMQIRMMHEIHFVNTTQEPIVAWSTVNAYTIAPSEVTGHIWGFSVNDRNLSVPANGNATEWTRCTLTEDVDMLFFSTHTHALGKRASISLVHDDGQTELLYENRNWHFPPLMQMDPPLHIAAGSTMELRCEFDNYTNRDVSWGYSAQDEMCEMIFVFMNADQSTQCTPIESSDGVLDDTPPASPNP